MPIGNPDQSEKMSVSDGLLFNYMEREREREEREERELPAYPFRNNLLRNVSHKQCFVLNIYMF